MTLLSNALFIYWQCVCIAAAWLIMHTIEYLIEISTQRRKRLILLASCYVLNIMIIYIGDPFNILMTTLIFLVVIIFTCKGSLWKKVTIGLIFVSTVFSFSALRDNYLYAHTPLFIYVGLDRSIPCTASCLFALFLYIGMRKFAPDQDYELSDSMWKLLFLLTAVPVGIVLDVVVLFQRYDNNNYTPTYKHYEYAILLVIALLSFVSLLWCITVLAKQQKLERQNIFAKINREYYHSMEQQHFEIRRLKHDLANHLQILSALPEEQRGAYIQNLTENAALTQSLSYCGDATVNAVLSVKKNMMDRYGIRLELTVDIPAELPFDKTDVCALCANALDNAAEACRKLRAEERAVTLKIKAQKGLFCLEVSNPLPVENASATMQTGGLQRGTIPPTSKTDKSSHGFGLKSIKEIVERYHGSLELKNADGVFDLFLYIPLAQV